MVSVCAVKRGDGVLVPELPDEVLDPWMDAERPMEDNNGNMQVGVSKKKCKSAYSALCAVALLPTHIPFSTSVISSPSFPSFQLFSYRPSPPPGAPHPAACPPLLPIDRAALLGPRPLHPRLPAILPLPPLSCLPQHKLYCYIFAHSTMSAIQ